MGKTKQLIPHRLPSAVLADCPWSHPASRNWASSGVQNQITIDGVDICTQERAKVICIPLDEPTQYMEFPMSRVEYLFALEIQHRKSRLLRPSQQLFFRRAYWWIRLQWVTAKWKVRQIKQR